MSAPTAVAEWPIGSCDSCPTPVIWCTTTRNERMPVDAAPVADGDIVLKARHGGVPLAVVLPVAQRFGRVLRVSHFSTCPKADQHRRKR